MPEMHEGPPKAAWAGCCALAIKDGIGKVADLPDGIYDRKLDERWRFVLNGGDKTVDREGLPKIPRFNIYIEYNGWPAGIIGPFEGIIAAGGEANEDSFIAALETQLGKSVDDALAGR